MTPRAWFAVCAVAALTVAGLSAIAYTVFQDKVEAPTLELRSEFPEGYDVQEYELRAVGYDGRSRCNGLGPVVKSLLTLKPESGDSWGRDGIVSTKPPTQEDMLEAAPLPDPSYSVKEILASPTVQENRPFDEIRTDIGLCQFQYEAEIWQMPTRITNHEPITIRDDTDTLFQYALTSVRLGGRGDGDTGTRFLLVGTASDPENLTLDYRVYPVNDIGPEDILNQSKVSPLFTVNNTFAFVFDVPPLPTNEARLMLVPLNVKNGTSLAPVPGSMEFTSLARLETTKAILAGNSTPTGLERGWDYVTFDDEAPRIEAGSLSKAWEQAWDSQVVDSLEAMGHASFLIQQAVEPRAPIGYARIHQPVVKSQLVQGAALDVIDDSGKKGVKAVYTLSSTRQDTRLVMGLGITPLAATTAKVAGATATLSQMTADGVMIVKAVGDGATPANAVLSLHRAMDATGRSLELNTIKPGGTPDGVASLKFAQRWIVGAGLVAAGWEFLNAHQTTEASEKIHYYYQGVKIMTETLFSLTLAGAIGVAAVHVVGYLWDQHDSTRIPSILHRAWRTGILGKVSEENAQEAWEEVQPQIIEYAEENRAGYLEPKVQPVRKTPGFGLVWSLSCLGILAVAWKRKTIGGLR